MEDNLNQSDMDELLATMKREVQRQKKAQCFLVGGICLLIGLQIALAILALLSHWHTVIFPFTCFAGLIPMIVYGRMNTEARKKAVEELTKREDIRLVGPLCDVFAFQDAAMSKLAEAALIILLPRLKASDACLLNVTQRRLLYGRLMGENKPLVLAILSALEQVGDEKALPMVEKLAGRLGSGTTDMQIHAAAIACLPTLRERVEILRVGEDLLRASGPDVQPETLLRPAMATPETEPQELLRASQNEAV